MIGDIFSVFRGSDENLTSTIMSDRLTVYYIITENEEPNLNLIIAPRIPELEYEIRQLMNLIPYIAKTYDRRINNGITEVQVEYEYKKENFTEAIIEEIKKHEKLHLLEYTGYTVHRICGIYCCNNSRTLT